MAELLRLFGICRGRNGICRISVASHHLHVPKLLALCFLPVRYRKYCCASGEDQEYEAVFPSSFLARKNPKTYNSVVSQRCVSLGVVSCLCVSLSLRCSCCDDAPTRPSCHHRKIETRFDLTILFSEMPITRSMLSRDSASKTRVTGHFLYGIASTVREHAQKHDEHTMAAGF